MLVLNLLIELDKTKCCNAYKLRTTQDALVIVTSLQNTHTLTHTYVHKHIKFETVVYCMHIVCTL